MCSSNQRLAARTVRPNAGFWRCRPCMLEWCGAANKTASCSANRSGALLCQTEKISRTYNKAEIRREVRRVYTLKGSECRSHTIIVNLGKTSLVYCLVDRIGRHDKSQCTHWPSPYGSGGARYLLFSALPQTWDNNAHPKLISPCPGLSARAPYRRRS